MPKNEEMAVALAKLSSLLLSIESDLADYRHIDEDDSWAAEGTPPPEVSITGAGYALEKYRSVDSAVGEAWILADGLTTRPLIRKVREMLHVLVSELGQADVPAQWALTDGFDDEAIGICRDHFRQAHRTCGRRLKLLAAKLAVAVDDGLENGADRADSKADKPKKLQPKDKDVAWLCRRLGKETPKGVKAIDIAREIAGDNEAKAKSLLRQARRYRHLWQHAKSGQ